MLAILWLAMMLVWMGGLIYGVWWVWPLVQQLSVTPDVVLSLVWLVIGAAAWIVALNLGIERYWRRR